MRGVHPAWWILLCLLAVAALWQTVETLPPDATAVVCAIAKNEGPYIDEWVAYHLALGFDAVHVYDNSDAHDLRDLPARFPRGRVHVRHWPGGAQQVPAYNHFLGSAGGVTWAAFLDVDEFVVLKKHTDVKALLRERCRDGALGLNWYLFGSSGKADGEPAPVTRRFLRRDVRVNRHVKSIVRVADVLRMDVHHPAVLVLGARQRDTSGRAFSGPFHPEGPSDVAVIHHYFTKSRAEFLQKRARGMATGPGLRSLQEFDDHDCNAVEDTSAADAARRMGL